MGTNVIATGCSQAVDGHDPSIAAYTGDPSMARKYDSYHEYLHGLFEYDSAFLEKVLPPASRVLDLGCGTGRHVVRLAELGFEVTGADLSEHMLKETAKKLDKHGVEAKLVQADICDLGVFEDSSVDCGICMFSTLGLIRGKALRRKALAEWRRVLRVGGVLALHVHNAWHNLLDSAGRGWLVRSLLGSIVPGHEFGDSWIPEYFGLDHLYLHLFGWGELKGLLRASGFAVERAVFLDDARTGVLSGWSARLRANGFLVAAKRVR